MKKLWCRLVGHRPETDHALLIVWCSRCGEDLHTVQEWHEGMR